MNRVLSWPHTPMLNALLGALKRTRQRTVISDHGMVRFEHALGTVEMKFARRDEQLPPGTPVFVWWKGGGFVCATQDEMMAMRLAERHLADRLAQARAHLARVRQQRREEFLMNLDLELPLDLDSLHAVTAAANSHARA